jgi:hypothetical protein
MDINKKGLTKYGHSIILDTYSGIEF